jgi:hypothetical protein
MLRLLVNANVPSLPNIVTPLMETIHSPETSVHTRATRATRANTPEDGILNRQCRETLHFALYMEDYERDGLESAPLNPRQFRHLAAWS